MAPKLRIILLKTKVSSKSRGSYEPHWDIPKRVAMRRGNDRVARSLVSLVHRLAIQQKNAL